MKYILFSDVHFHKEFEPKKFGFLKRIISNSDQVIILGDFWESTLMTFEEFVKSDWKQLFPLLKSKKTIYLYGNHDKKYKSDNGVNLFSTHQATQYSFKIGKQTFVTEHGDRFFRKHLLSRLTYAGPLERIIVNKYLINWYHTRFEGFIARRFGREMLQKLYKSYNDYVKKEFTKEFTNNEILICGHTHAQELDLKNRFVNTGIIRHGLGQYVVIDNGKISINEEWYDKP